MKSTLAGLSLHEVVEAEGHLIDSHIMEQIFDTVVEYQGRFEVEHFSIGRTNSEPSRLRLKVEAPSRELMDQMLAQLLGLGCSPVDMADATLATVERDRCAPDDFLISAHTKLTAETQRRKELKSSPRLCVSAVNFKRE